MFLFMIPVYIYIYIYGHGPYGLAGSHWDFRAVTRRNKLACKLLSGASVSPAGWLGVARGARLQNMSYP
jgi:hypothetical protein